MNEILKAASAQAAVLTDEELALINKQALRPLGGQGRGIHLQAGGLRQPGGPEL